MLSRVFAALAFACSALAISWPLILNPSTTSNNVWIELVYTWVSINCDFGECKLDPLSVHVPPGPPPTVTTGPWFFWVWFMTAHQGLPSLRLSCSHLVRFAT